MSGDFPPRCQDVCPADRMDLSDYPIVFTRNCDGPNPVADHVDQKVTLTKDGEMTVEHPDELLTPLAACRNTGFNQSLSALALAQGLPWDVTSRCPEDVGFRYTDLD